MTIQALGLRPVKPTTPPLYPTALGLAFTPELTSDVFTPSASAQSGIRFGFAPLREAEERIMGLAIDGGMDTHHKKALAQLFKVPGINVSARLPKRKFSRADGRYFHEAPDASAHNLLGLGWIRAAIDRKKNNDAALDEFEKTLVAAITSTDRIEALGKIVFDPVNAPAPKAYIRQVRKFANSPGDYMRIAIASGLAANLSINHFTPALQSIVNKLANDSDVPVRQLLAFHLAANPQLPFFSPAVQVVSDKLRNDSDSTVRRMYQHGLCSNPSIGDMNRDTIDYLLSVLRTPSLLSQNVTILASNPGLPRFPHAILRLLRGVTEPDDIRFLVPGLAGNKSLPSFPPMMVRVLRNLAASPNVEMRDQMARCLGQNPRIKKASQPVLDILANLARDKEGRVSETLFSALSWNPGIDPNKDLPGIFKLLE